MSDATYVILLRGVTPTGRNKVPMAPLREALTQAGLKGVRTYIQSGNVIAASDLPRAALENLVHAVIRDRFGGDLAVVARSAEQFAGILERNPFAGADATLLHFSLLATAPDPARLNEFLSIDFAPDQVRCVEDTIYTRYATRHAASKFNNNYFERKLNVAATTRNLNTMASLAAIAAG